MHKKDLASNNLQRLICQTKNQFTLCRSRANFLSIIPILAYVKPTHEWKDVEKKKKKKQIDRLICFQVKLF